MGKVRSVISAQDGPPQIDIALVGVPKAATTTLYYALASHPGIQGSNPKESYYFTDHVGSAWAPGQNFRKQGWRGFEQFFDGPRAGRLRLEASAINLYQETALTTFSAVRPKPLIIVVLRCPAEQIRSNFYFHRNYNRITPSADFGAYVAALREQDETALASMAPNAQFRSLVRHSLQWNHYAEWLDLWGRHFSRERMLVVTMAEVSREPERVLRSICDRVGLDSSFYEDFVAQRLNMTTAGRVRAPGPVSRLGRRLLPSGRLRDSVAAWDQRRRTGGPLGSPSGDEEEILGLLASYFAPFDEDLHARYGVDVSDWRSTRLSRA